MISSPFLAIWYTYLSTKSIFGVVFILPRLLINICTFALMSLFSDFYHGLRLGFVAGLLWPQNLGSKINAGASFSDLLHAFLMIEHESTPPPDLLIPPPTIVPEEKSSVPDLIVPEKKAPVLWGIH
ncbi:MAG: hypothetical protein H0U75_08530 [Legionella sp.]|nr:hypothetical protein [Legionella sp.]